MSLLRRFDPCPNLVTQSPARKSLWIRPCQIASSRGSQRERQRGGSSREAFSQRATGGPIPLPWQEMRHVKAPLPSPAIWRYAAWHKLPEARDAGLVLRWALASSLRRCAWSTKCKQPLQAAGLRLWTTQICPPWKDLLSARSRLQCSRNSGSAAPGEVRRRRAKPQSQTCARDAHGGAPACSARGSRP